MKKLSLFLFGLILLLPHTVFSEIRGEELAYSEGGTSFKGYIAYDDGIKEKRPGILVVHEWWGHNEYARKRARMLAEKGYVALAVDMYGDGKKAEHPDDAGAFAGEVMKNMESAKRRFEAALDTLKKHKMTDSGNMAAIGYCFGGGVVLNMARMGVDLKGVVSFHGSLGAAVESKPGTIKAKVLVCNGKEDAMVSPEQIEAFKKEMKKAGADYHFKNYEGAKHSFTNPDADKFAKKFDLPLAYNKKADRQSWNDMQRFLSDIFSK
ncbi:MAG: dienelactone hydrolase family protein [Deltaproteobacteria bacterium]|nr:dienelactone hydrolase family protein [Deltaproteobacteria bacterium]